MKRPVSVTVTCWVIIALAAEAIVGLLSGVVEASLKELIHAIDSPLSFSTTVVSGLVTAVITAILAIFMLRGANSARVAYIALSGISLLAMLVIYSHVPTAILVLTATKFLVFSLLLLRPEANQYFSPPRSVVQHDVAV